MSANDLSYFFTITISTMTTMVTFSIFLYIKGLYIQIFDKVICQNKEIMTDIKIMVDSESQTEYCNNVHINSSSYIEIEYVTLSKIKDSLENLMLLAKDQLIIQQNPSNYKWFFGK